MTDDSVQDARWKGTLHGKRILRGWPLIHGISRGVQGTIKPAEDRGGTSQTGLKLSAYLSCHQDSVVRNPAVQHYRRYVRAATALGFDPSSYRRLDPSEQDANQPQATKGPGSRTRLTPLGTR